MTQAPHPCAAYQTPRASKTKMVRDDRNGVKESPCLAAASIRRAVIDFMLRVCPANAIPNIIGLQAFRTLSGNQKLFPHFSEAGAAVFAIEQVEYGGHGAPIV
ncbi:hypothetical protein GGD66_007919 [Bradyrhizobium sp. CIR48]|uniref:hypothetical protein n=1 Tax=unclassified Bradyrhizobium TaxID=2631580 RepID=UPI001605D9A8|nr:MULTISPECIES: hypothetical protein [unclassified Bradyrhizobium]MBB4366172.1 hypothetical protein [Bradyrhizobium sp. CIR18]MBB4429317.1 hypothetical protein [Bradyrhizobium sp. CIR48]